MDKSLGLSLDDILRLIPKALAWVEAIESHVLVHGSPLDARGFEDAQKMGVVNPDVVRFLRVKAMPMPDDPEIAVAAQALGFLSPSTVGLTLGKSILLREDFAHSRQLLAHELVHVGQWERMGHEAFLEAYIRECAVEGYPHGPLEKEAVERSLVVPDEWIQ